MKGRPRIAPEIHKINGSYAINPNRENKSAPEADGREPEMPEYFGEDECRKWMELIADMRQMGILSTDSREILIAYCCAYGGWMAARRAVKISGIALASREPSTYDSKGKEILGKPEFKRNPFCVELHKYRDEMNRLLPEFGLTPSSRSRLVSLKPADDDPFAAWMEARGSG